MSSSKPQSSPSSGKQQTCMEMLQAMLDGDTTPDQEAAFREHIEFCMPCYKSYNLEMTIKELLKTKCCGNGAPPELINRIKSNIDPNLKS